MTTTKLCFLLSFWSCSSTHPHFLDTISYTKLQNLHEAAIQNIRHQRNSNAFSVTFNNSISEKSKPPRPKLPQKCQVHPKLPSTPKTDERDQGHQKLPKCAKSCPTTAKYAKNSPARQDTAKYAKNYQKLPECAKKLPSTPNTIQKRSSCKKC